MLKIATHDSATGEKGMWYSLLVVPFACTQSKTIKEQYDAGCRLFDLRFKLVGDKWKMAHGLWITKRTAEDIIAELNSFEDVCHCTFTYEGDADHNEQFLCFISKLKSLYKHIKYGPVAVKYGKDTKGVAVKYDYIMDADPNWIDAGSVSKFLKLDGRSWHTYLPIPWLWKKLYYNNPEFNETEYTYVDFL